VKLSTRSRYGARLMVDLALHYNQGPVQLSEISKRQDISVKYLEQILIPLKKAGYVVTVRGPKGGYMLADPPEEITMAQIVELLEGRRNLVACMANPEICSRSDVCITKNLWEELTEMIYEKLESITLADLAEKARRKDENRKEME